MHLKQQKNQLKNTYYRNTRYCGNIIALSSIIAYQVILKTLVALLLWYQVPGTVLVQSVTEEV